MARGKAAQAAPELLVLARWEETADFLLELSGRWPSNVRFTLTRRVQNHALDVLELLIDARYIPAVRAEALKEVNHRLEKMRFLLRLARKRDAVARKGFEGAMRQIDETGRMVHGWRVTLR